MPRRQPYKFLKREATRHGKVVWYLRRVGQPKIRLPGYPGELRENEAAYYAALENKPIIKAPGEGRFAAGTFGDLCARYLGSNKFLLRAPITQATYRNQIDPLRIEFGHIPLKQFERRHIVALMDRKAGKPGAANTLLKMLKILFGDGVIAGLMDKNPAVGVEGKLSAGRLRNVAGRPRGDVPQAMAARLAAADGV